MPHPTLEKQAIASGIHRIAVPDVRLDASIGLVFATIAVAGYVNPQILAALRDRNLLA